MTTPPSLPPDVRSAVQAGRKIDAIRLLREATGLGLKEAKDAVEAFEAGEAPPALSPGAVKRGLDKGSWAIAIVGLLALVALYFLR